jgi:hypothetical protein
MSEHVPSSGSPVKWLFPVILLSIIALLALYIVRDNYNERIKASTVEVNKDTRSDYLAPGLIEPDTDSTSGKSGRMDSSARERASQPVLDTTR